MTLYRLYCGGSKIRQRFRLKWLSYIIAFTVDTGKAQNTLGGFKMTIENARALQEQLANEAIAQLRKNGNNELVDDCIQSIAVVGKA